MGRAPFYFCRCHIPKMLLLTKHGKNSTLREAKRLRKGLIFPWGEKTKTSHREVYIFKMYLFYQPHACKSNISSKIFCRQRYSGNTLEAAYLSATITRLAQRDEYQMLSPTEMTACLPACQLHTRSQLPQRPSSISCSALLSWLCPGPVRAF